jgi:hypothetical protein
VSYFTTHTVTLNLFQGPLRLHERRLNLERWMLKQVQHDKEDEVVAI